MKGFKPLDCMTDQKFQDLNELQSRIKKALESSRHNQSNQMNLYQVNFIFLQGHGGLHQQEPCLIIPDHKVPGKLRLLNVEKLAKEFAKINKTITIIFFDACREDLDKPDFKNLFTNSIIDDPLFDYKPLKRADSFPGYSAIVYSCKQWGKSAETFDETLTYD